MNCVRTSDQINDLASALAKAQGDLENVGRAGMNPHFRAKYATLGDVLDEVRPKFAKHGIAILQLPVNGEGPNIGITTRFVHSSGQWIESTLYVAPIKFDAQGAGSVLSYLRRYSLMAMAGVGPDDDDGEAAVGRPAPRTGSSGAAPAPNGISKAAVPISPEEPPEINAARQRIRGLIDKYQQIIRTAPDRRALELALDDGREEIAEIEQAGPKGKDAATTLRRRAEERLAQFDEAA